MSTPVNAKKLKMHDDLDKHRFKITGCLSRQACVFYSKASMLTDYFHFRNGLAKDIADSFSSKKAQLKQRLQSTRGGDVSITIDLWTDRRMRSFMGVTAHYIYQGELCSSLLDCRYVTGNYHVTILMS